MHSYQRYVKQPEKKKRSWVFIAAVEVIGNKVNKMKSKATEGTRTIVLVGKKLVFWRIFKIPPLVLLSLGTDYNLKWIRQKKKLGLVKTK